jgi:hypothetical protein
MSRLVRFSQSGNISSNNKAQVLLGSLKPVPSTIMPLFATGSSSIKWDGMNGLIIRRNMGNFLTVEAFVYDYDGNLLYDSGDIKALGLSWAGQVWYITDDIMCWCACGVNGKLYFYKKSTKSCTVFDISMSSSGGNYAITNNITYTKGKIFMFSNYGDSINFEIDYDFNESTMACTNASTSRLQPSATLACIKGIIYHPTYDKYYVATYYNKVYEVAPASLATFLTTATGYTRILLGASFSGTFSATKGGTSTYVIGNNVVFMSGKVPVILDIPNWKFISTGTVSSYESTPLNILYNGTIVTISMNIGNIYVVDSNNIINYVSILLNSVKADGTLVSQKYNIPNMPNKAQVTFGYAKVEKIGERYIYTVGLHIYEGGVYSGYIDSGDITDAIVEVCS